MRVADLQVTSDREVDHNGEPYWAIRLDITLADNDGNKVVDRWFVCECDTEIQGAVYVQDLGKKLQVG